MVIGSAAQEGKEVAHPVGNAKSENVAIKVGDLLHLGDVEGDMAELVRHHPLGLESLTGELAALEHLHDGALRVREGDGFANGGLWVLLAFGLDALGADLLLEGVEIVVGRDLETDTHAFRFRALAQHHRVVIDRAGKVSRILVAIDQGETEDLRVVLDLLVHVRRFVAGMGNFADADHGKPPLLLVREGVRGSEPMTSTMAATSRSLNPMSMKR